MRLDFITLLLVCQLIGETVSRLLELTLPGPVIGMVLLFGGLVLRDRVTGRGVPEGLQQTAGGLLQHLSLLFVPAGVGVVTHLNLVADQWLPITAALLVSTIATIAVTALVMVALARLTGNAATGDALKED
jgi:holin-like protein